MKVAVIGANGQVARIVERFLIADKEVDPVLFLRKSDRLTDLQNDAQIIEGDARNVKELTEAIKGCELVYANLNGSGQSGVAAKALVDAMHAAGVKRLIWVSTIGIYNEVPGKFGEWNNRMLNDYLPLYHEASDIIENSDLEYTIVRPSWMTDKNEVDYEKFAKGQEFTDTEVSRKSVAAYIFHIIRNPQEDKFQSIGLGKPGTAGDKPSWY